MITCAVSMFAVNDAYLIAGLTPPVTTGHQCRAYTPRKAPGPPGFWARMWPLKAQGVQGLGSVHLHDQHQAPAARPRVRAGQALAELPEAKQEKHRVLILLQPHHLHFIC